MQQTDELLTLSPLDGRYAFSTQELRPYFSEFALMKYRISVELEYLLFLSRQRIIRTVKPKEKIFMRHIVSTFSVADAGRIKTVEGETRHDIKALEYFLKEKLANSTLRDILPFVHIGLTSEDVNSIAYSLMLKDSQKFVIGRVLHDLLLQIRALALGTAGSLMLAKTHGKPAVPTTFGKELSVFYVRLNNIERDVRKFRFDGKLNGAVGNYNALAFLYPHVNWITYSKKFISSLGLVPNVTTTQILPSDTLIAYTSMLGRINGILIGFCQDMWLYISQGLLVLKHDAKQVGSSTMPHKVNPIDFENAEGNLMVANSYFELYVRKLPVSRLQRDLSDSTIKRTIGTSLGHTILAWKSLIKGLGAISFDRQAAASELNAHWEILSEAVQVYLKVHGDEKGYETVKDATMGKQFDAKTFRRAVKLYPALAKLTPYLYSGLAKKIAESALKS